MGLRARVLVAVVLCVLASIAIAQLHGAPMRKKLRPNSRQAQAHKGRNPVGGSRRGPYNSDDRDVQRAPFPYRPDRDQASVNDEDDNSQMAGGYPLHEPQDYNEERSNDANDDATNDNDAEEPNSTPDDTTTTTLPTDDFGEGGVAVTSPSTPASSTGSTTTIDAEEERKSSTPKPTASATSTTDTPSDNTTQEPTHVQYGLIAVIALLFLGVVAVNAVSIVVCCQTKGKCVGKKDKSTDSKSPRGTAGGDFNESQSSAVEYDQSIDAEEAAAIYARKYGGLSNSD